MSNPLQSEDIRGKMLLVDKGYLVCPYCRRNRRVMRIEADTVAHRMPAFCRTCKREWKVDIFKGQCFESQGR